MQEPPGTITWISKGEGRHNKLTQLRDEATEIPSFLCVHLRTPFLCIQRTSVFHSISWNIPLWGSDFPPIFFTHNSVHVLASVAFRFHSALVHIQLCVRSSLPLCPSSSACMCVCLVGLNLVSEGRKFWGSCEHPLFSFCFNLFSLIFWGRIFFADLGSDQLELSALQLWLNCLSLNVQLRCYLAA